MIPKRQRNLLKTDLHKPEPNQFHRPPASPMKNTSASCDRPPIAYHPYKTFLNVSFPNRFTNPIALGLSGAAEAVRNPKQASLIKPSGLQ